MTLTHKQKERFLSRFIPEPNTGCWLWTGAADSGGYGVVGISNKTHSTHRLMYRIHHGEIPPKTEICHKCDTPSCGNPDHLFLGDRASNMKDAAKKGRMSRPSKTVRFCKRGHQRTLDNLYFRISKSGYKTGYCKKCRNQNLANWLEKQPGGSAAYMLRWYYKNKTKNKRQ